MKKINKMKKLKNNLKKNMKKYTKKIQKILYDEINR